MEPGIVMEGEGVEHQVHGRQGCKLHTHPHDHHHVSDDQLEVCGGGRVVHEQLYEAVRLVTGVVGEQGLREHGEAGQR